MFGPGPVRSYPPDCGVVGCSGGVVDILLLSLGRSEARQVDDFQLQPVGIVEEDRVVARAVRVLLRLTLELDVLRAEPVRALVDVRPGLGLEGDVMQADPVAVVRLRLRLRLAQPDRRSRPADVPDRLAAFAL